MQSPSVAWLGPSFVVFRRNARDDDHTVLTAVRPCVTVTPASLAVIGDPRPVMDAAVTASTDFQGISGAVVADDPRCPEQNKMTPHMLLLMAKVPCRWVHPGRAWRKHWQMRCVNVEWFCAVQTPG